MFKFFCFHFTVFVTILNTVLSYMNPDNTYSLNEIVRGNLYRNDISNISLIPETHIRNISTHEDVDKSNPDLAFNGVYYECLFFLSYTCIQRKTLEYLERLNSLKEVSVIGSYVKFVKVENKTYPNTSRQLSNHSNLTSNTSHQLSSLIDDAVEDFFDQHSLIIGSGKVDQARTFDEVMGRAKKRKGGGGGGGHGGGHGGGDGGKKKMMMMAMMCMKMKMMMMIPAMMGVMGMMSFKGMMFGMMSFMIAKMMLLMKILQIKGMGGGGSGHSGGGDSGWAGGAGGQWVPAGSGSDGYGGGSGGGGGGGYNAAGEWQSGRSLPEKDQKISESSKRINQTTENSTTNGTITKNIVMQRYQQGNDAKHSEKVANLYGVEADDMISSNQPHRVEYTSENHHILGKTEIKSRKKRGIVDILTSMGSYWAQKLFNANLYAQTPYKRFVYPKNRIINGMRYEYFPYTSKRNVYRNKYPKMVVQDEEKLRNPEDNKLDLSMNIGESEALPVDAESRMFKMSKKNKKKMKDMQEIVDDNPWE